MMHIKVLSFLFLTPFLSHAQMFFKCDKDREAKIIHTDRNITREGKGEYSIAGNVIMEVWGHQYTCDSAVFYCKKNQVAIFGVTKISPEFNVHFPCDTPRGFDFQKRLMLIDECEVR